MAFIKQKSKTSVILPSKEDDEGQKNHSLVAEYMKQGDGEEVRDAACNNLLIFGNDSLKEATRLHPIGNSHSDHS